MAKKRQQSKKQRNIEETEKWKNADWDYTEMVASNMMPFISPPLTGDTKIEYLKRIIKICPEYFPALVDLGCTLIQEDSNENGVKYIDKGLQSMRKHFPKKEWMAVYHTTCENLEKLWHFELAIQYYDQLLELEDDKANVYDSISYCYAYLGEFDKAFEYQKKAIELNKSNSKFYCNLGWIEMLRGNLTDAKAILEKSIKLDKNDKITSNNYGAVQRMIKDKKLHNWEEFLLRDIDEKYLEKLEDEDDMEEYGKQVSIYNANKMEAFRLYLLKKKTGSSSEKRNIISTLNVFFNFVSEIDGSSFFFYDDIDHINEYFKLIMHKFIFKMGDIDDEIFDDVYTSVLEFYKFLNSKKVITGYNNVKKKMLRLKPELSEKMHRYNEIRHNSDYTEEEKEEIREELFEGDHCWPFL